jgi:hypothetical protein
VCACYWQDMAGQDNRRSDTLSAALGEQVQAPV